MRLVIIVMSAGGFVGVCGYLLGFIHGLDWERKGNRR